MNKEKEIEEMKQVLVDYAKAHDLCFSFEAYRRNAETLYNAGYRKVEQGKWIVDFNNPYRRRKVKCSVCGEYSGIGGNRKNQDKSNCHNCGAKIDNLIKEMTEEQK